MLVWLLYAANVPGMNYRTDAHALAKGHFLVITKAKNEIGSSGSGPYLQATLYYDPFVSMKVVENSLPILLCIQIFYFGK